MILRAPGGPGDGVPRPVITCDSTECQSALAEVATDRNRVLSKCAQVAATRDRVNFCAAIATAFATLAAGLLAAAAAASATWVGIPAAIVLLVVAIVMASIALTFATFAVIGAIQLAVQQGELGREKTRFTDAASAVMTACPSTCWGDLTLPTCS